MSEFRVSVPPFDCRSLSEVERYFEELGMKLNDSISQSLDERAKAFGMEKALRERRSRIAATLQLRSSLLLKVDQTDKFILATEQLFCEDIPDSIIKDSTNVLIQTDQNESHDQEAQTSFPQQVQFNPETEAKLTASLEDNARLQTQLSAMGTEYAAFKKQAMGREARAAETAAAADAKVADLQTELIKCMQRFAESEDYQETLRNEARAAKQAAARLQARLDTLAKNHTPGAAELEVQALRMSLKRAESAAITNRQILAKFQEKCAAENQALRSTLEHIRSKFIKN